MATTDTTLVNLKEWLNQTLPWLGADGTQSSLRDPHRQLLDKLRRAQSEQRLNNIWDLITELGELAERADETRAKGEILLHCAKVAADLENLRSALQYFQRAEGKYKGFPHPSAVVQWMTGCVHWVMGQEVDGITEWQSAIQAFTDLRRNAGVDTVRANWYMERLEKMERALRIAIDTDALPPCNLSTPEPAVPDAANAQAEPEEDPISFEGDSLLWISTQVSESIPAGGFGPAGYDPHPIGSLEISEVVIEDEPHDVITIERPSTRRNRVDINSQRRYHVLCVTGTSMNAARPVPILDGDFVLVRLQSDAQDNDIVVVGIQGLDSRATIKRLRKRNGQIQLVPETTDPVHSEIDWEQEYDEHDEQIQIIGVVEAIFRRKNGK